ncbi:ImmA/IrrE family metallo-endopeptidase [Bifidobacterium sp. 82T24]|nr:ImmA/IrrE family metallo-endopeptidase [Bifidobacterium pluvialisilvae]
MTYGQMHAAAQGLGIIIRSLPRMEGSLMGAYDEETKTIFLDQRLLPVQKRCTLMHELVHWEHGDETCGTIYDTKAERRTRIETARRLITLTEYATLENIYEGDKYAIAEELNVTVSLLEDYRTWLQENAYSSVAMRYRRQILLAGKSRI